VIRATLEYKFPATLARLEEQLGVTEITINGFPLPNQGQGRNFPLTFVNRITQLGIGPIADVATVVNSFVGGRRKSRRRKTKRRTKRRTKRTRRRRKRRRKTRK